MSTSKRLPQRIATDLPRRTALEVLRRVRRGDAWQRAWEDDPLAPGSRDRRFAHELASGVLRLRNRLDFALAPHLARPLADVDPDVQDILRLGAYQLLEMSKIGAPAAVHTSVELAKATARRAHGFVNAVLRRLAADAGNVVYPDFTADALGWLVHYASHPEWLARRWLQRFGPEPTRRLAEYDNTRPEICLRVNRLRATREDVLEELHGCRAGALSPWSVRGGDAFAALRPALESGRVSVQDEGATRIGDFCGAARGETWIDLAAAPGGKACHLAEAVGPSGRVLALDVSESKAGRIRENAVRLGLDHVAVAVGDARHVTLQPADGVLLDAPCSGRGVLARRADARWRKREADLPRLQRLQGELLAAAAKRVRPGGTLVYSVCSFEPEETAQVTERFAATHPGFVAASESLHGGPDVLYLLPHEHGVDGAFAARWRRQP
jgi:16S rRNA (cytosine967-C5)-methyltransferase